MTDDTPTTLHRLAAGDLQVDIDLKTGSIVSVRYGTWPVLDRSELGESFRLLVPVEGRRANWVIGSQQPAPAVQASPTSVEAVWHTVTDQHGTTIEATVRTVIRADPDQLVFSVEVDNRSTDVVENVYFPDLGDVSAPPDTGQLESFGYQYATAQRTRLRPRFTNHPGYFGVEHPTTIDGPMFTAPQTPWVLLQDGSRGLYLGVDQPSAEPVTWFAELLPGYGDSLEGTVPAETRIAGQPVAVHVAAVHLPFVLPGESRQLTPIALAGFTGDWHAGVDHYTRHREHWQMPDAPGPQWIHEPHAWLQYQMNSPEGERRLRFEELPQLAAECAAADVRTIQLVGWNEGGQDQNNPSHEADEALGGRDALLKAIKDCQRLGVRIILFSKFTWADRATERFRRELIAEAIKDPYGDYYQHPGYRYQTVSQLLDLNTKRLIPMCFSSERYLEICEEEFDKVASSGADGMLFDEALHHGPALVCFDTSHGHRIGHPVYANDRLLVDRFRKRPGVSPDFLFAAEAPYDWMLEAYELGYHRSENRFHIPLSRYLRPHAELMTAVTGFDDRNMINQCLMYRYVISYEPFNFKGRPGDAPATLQYGSLVDDLRRRYREWLWDATFVDTVGLEVRTADGQPHHPAAAFRHQDGRLAAVIANYEDTPVDLAVSVDHGASTPLSYRVVDGRGWHPVSDGVALAPRSAAIVLPDDAVDDPDGA